MASEETQAPFSAEQFFATQPPPPTLDEDVARVRQFIKRHTEANQKIVLVTSGGTTVPLELNVVRFLDNFSAGTRGATSAEYFLKAGYAVIFMHRQFSLQPFSRHYSHSTHPFLDFLDVDEHEVPARIDVKSSERPQLLSVLSQYKQAHEGGTLHTLTFVTVNDYLWLLRALSQELYVCGRNVLFYLAAAVSDFFLPRQKMSEHKIQSGKGSLHIEMDQVPKILKPLVSEWTREGFIVSFKLETDHNLLIPKARGALARYGHQVVIGNNLHRRKFEVVFVAPAAVNSGTRPTPGQEPSEVDPKDFVETWLRIDLAKDPHKEIEEDIVAELVRRHQLWASAA
ncbi:phosphopantothenate-cysteine ligase [Irpex rosettiformis]|uniref:Phosphopantothenate-cysteine ligase n=1 Tax=Irpex rosettiformis TaxID=378272 RepID=A0ACB8TZF1_9APHY|nr:phosphopantothenate-cysteine ligase [Irpex rosettiformis]